VIVVAADRLATPRIKAGVAGVLHLVSVATSLETLGLNLITLGIEVGNAVPFHTIAGLVSVLRTDANDLDARLGHVDDLGEVGDASLVSAGADEDVANLGTIDRNSLVFEDGRDDGVHID